eukprot:snap_masked-scaffold_59-processed-gene-0.39-mRNA-1 protein AED:1.00 eAED:1.00 QI:0/-1/0/0/-1/1/1/0/114
MNPNNFISALDSHMKEKISSGDEAFLNQLFTITVVLRAQNSQWSRDGTEYHILNEVNFQVDCKNIFTYFNIYEWYEELKKFGFAIFRKEGRVIVRHKYFIKDKVHLMKDIVKNM